MQPIQFIGLKDFSQEEQGVIKAISEDYYGKIKDLVDEELGIVVHMKDQGKGGKTKKYYSMAKVQLANKVIESDATDFDVRRVMHKVFKECEAQIKHKLKSDSQGHKGYE